MSPDRLVQGFIQASLENLLRTDCTTLLGNLIRHLTVLRVRRCLLIPSLNLSFQLLPKVPHPSAMYHHEQPSSVILPTVLPPTVGARDLLLGPPEAVSFPG